MRAGVAPQPATSTFSNQGGEERKLSPPVRVLLVGGPDVRARGDLMRSLERSFEVMAAGSEPRDAEHFARLGFAFHCFPMRRGSTPLADLRTFVSLYRLCRRVRPDILHAFATKPCVWGRVAARLAGVPIVIGTIPGLGSLYSAEDFRRRTLKRIYEALQRSASQVSDLTVFQNEQDARQLTQAGVVPPGRSTVIPGSGVRTDVFHRKRVSGTAIREMRACLDLSERDVLVTMISRVIRTKGVLTFVEAAERVRLETNGVKFLLVGPDDRNSVDRLSSEELARISSAVTWLGERDDVLEILAATDVFTLPTYYREGVPRVLLEAASMSLPLIATRRPGCDEIVMEGRNGFLVPPKDPAALGRAILQLAGSTALRRRYAEQSRQIAVENFDVAVIANRTVKLYRDLLASRGNGKSDPEALRPSAKRGEVAADRPRRAQSMRSSPQSKQSPSTAR